MNAPRLLPIPFRAEMVRKLLAGEKTQTRRLMKPQPSHWSHHLQPMWGTSPDGVAFGEPYCWREVGPDYPDGPEDDRRPRYRPGDRLWVQEPIRSEPTTPDEITPTGLVAVYAADGQVVRKDGRAVCYDWIAPRLPSIFCPRYASRMTLEVLDVRPEPLHEISEADAIAEGFQPGLLTPPIEEVRVGEYVMSSPGTSASAAGMFLVYMEMRMGQALMDANPYLWAYTFQRVE